MPVPAEMMLDHSVSAADSPETENSRGRCDICASGGSWSPSRENKREGLILKGAGKASFVPTSVFRHMWHLQYIVLLYGMCPQLFIAVERGLRTNHDPR